MKKIRIGILGCANIAVRTILPTLEKHPEFEITALASRSKCKGAPLAEKYNCRLFSYQELLNAADIDAVYVPLPTGLHAEWVMKLLAVGKHTLCEKSLGCSLAEVQEMVDLAQRRNLALMETFQFRFHRQNLHARELVRSGHIGEVRCFRSSFGFPPFPDSNNIRYNCVLGGGALLDAGAYTLKVVDFILGGDFTVKSAILRYDDSSEVDLGGGIMLADSKGAIAELAFGFDNFYQCNYEVWGSKGKLTVQRAFTAPKDFIPDILLEDNDGKHQIQIEPDDHFFNMFTEFANKIKNSDFASEYEKCLRQANLMEQTRTSCL